MYINLQNSLIEYIVYNLYFTYLAFAYVLYIVYYRYYLKISVTLKMGIEILQKLSILCYEVAASNYKKLKHIFTKYTNNSIVY